MKQEFNVNKSLEECSPSKIYRKGTIFKKRLILNRNSVTYPRDENPRELQVNTDNVPSLKDSFEVNGFITSCPPPTVKVDPNNSARFIGLSGYHRNAAASALNWETMIYDVLEFDSPKDELLHKCNSNAHKTPTIEQTNDDVAKNVIIALERKYISNDDDSIMDFISNAAPEKTSKKHKDIYKKVRERHGKYSTVITYHAGNGENSAYSFALQHNIPYDGDRLKDQSGVLGYITGDITPKTTLFGAKKLSRMYDGENIYIFSWIKKDPKPNPAMRIQRKSWKDKFDDFIKEDCESMRFIAQRCGFDIPLDVLIKNHPVKFVGFLAQDIAPDETKGGRPTEEGIVDVDGNPITFSPT